MKKANWSYGIKKFSLSKEETRLDLFSDLDSIAIEEAKQRWEKQRRKSPWVHLEDFIVDVGNMVAYPRFSPLGLVAFKVVRTDHNDRARSRISSRKPLDMASANNPIASSYFAKKMAEFGNTWFEECNGKKWPSARQVFTGLEATYEMELQR